MPSTPTQADTSPRRAPHRLPQIILIAAVLALGLWLALGGYKRLTTPNPRWQLPNGHTVEILANHPQRGFGPDSDDLKLSRYALVQFRSTLQDSLRDVNDIHAIADLICQSADSLGYRLIKVEATANPWFAIVRLSRARWFRIDSDGECHQFESLQMKLAPNMRLKLSGWGGHIGRKRSILIVAAPARSLSAIR